MSFICAISEVRWENPTRAAGVEMLWPSSLGRSNLSCYFVHLLINLPHLITDDKITSAKKMRAESDY